MRGQAYDTIPPPSEIDPIKAVNGKVVIAVINGEMTVKRLIKRGQNKLFLMPENVNYPAIEITEEMDFMIWGVVTNVIHEV